MGIVWLLSAAWFAVRWPGSARGKAWHFVRTLLPEPWLLVGLPILFGLLSLVPGSLWAHVTYRQPLVEAIGAAMTVASVLLLVWARLSLGEMWAGRPMVQERHELRTGGPYRLVRHPIYTGLLGMVLGSAMVSGFGMLTAVVLCALAWLLWRVRVEDGMMAATFGDRFREYQRRVPALFPLPRRPTAG
jgi:protein-S-isoprenylcysteine O-methyltransferase Ste14